MELEKKKTEIEWYDNPGIVTNVIIALIGEDYYDKFFVKTVR